MYVSIRSYHSSSVCKPFYLLQYLLFVSSCKTFHERARTTVELFTA